MTTGAASTSPASATSPSTRIAAERLIEQIDDFLAALDGIASLRRTRPAAAKASVRFYRDPRAAWQNGLRSALTLFAAGAIWIVTGWPHGDMMLLIVAPYCALLAAAPNPVAGAWQFVKGTVIAVPMAFLCAFGVLPHLDGLPLLLIVLALFWLPGIYATTLPRHGLAALAYLVGFNTLTAADNPMHYNLPLFLNWSIAWIVGTLVAWMGFRLLLPREMPRDIARLKARVRDAGLRVLRTSSATVSPVLSPSVDALPGNASTAARLWQWRQQHRIAQLGAQLGAFAKAQPDGVARDIDNALASLSLGREVWRLRAWLVRDGQRASLVDAHTLVANTLDRMARRLGSRHPAPALAARHARHAARRLHRTQASMPLSPHDANLLLRLVAALTDIADLLDGHAVYFAQPSFHRSHAQ